VELYLRFGAFAQCTVCEESVMEPRDIRHRYAGAHSCIQCEALCCTACCCQCTCMALCGFQKHGDGEVCANCRGWCHLDCASIYTSSPCDSCSVKYYKYCTWSVYDCEICDGIFCHSCSTVYCCDECERSFCTGCRDSAIYESCDSSFCFQCRVVRQCEKCKVYFGDSCGH
jgi:hypothetical protein